jgi:hypothetical protein
MKFVKKNLMDVLTPSRRSELLMLLDSIPAIGMSLDAGGWICGGFVRHMMLDIPIAEYFFPQDTRRNAGDIDIFFSSVESANRAVEASLLAGNGGKSVHPSFGRFANDVTAIFAKRRIKIQFVNHPDKVHDSVESTLKSFDFMNCMAAITNDGIVYCEGWHELEKSNLLKICNAKSPFLGSRILKYLNFRGVSGITPDSREMLTEWLLLAMNQRFEGYAESKHLDGVESAVKRLRQAGMVSQEELIFFIGKYFSYIETLTGTKENYGEYQKVDWALTQLDKSASNDLTDALPDK